MVASKPPPPSTSSTTTTTTTTSDDISAAEALKRAAKHLEKLQSQHPGSRSRRRHRGDELLVQSNPDASYQQQNMTIAEESRELFQEYIQYSANSLKQLLKKKNLPRQGRKPEMAQRLVDNDLRQKYSQRSYEEDEADAILKDAVDAQKQAWTAKQGGNDDDATGATHIPGLPLRTFAGFKELSDAAGEALGNAGFVNPTPIQAAAIPPLKRGESAILHAETGSGKSLAYLLPITERLWRVPDDQTGFAVILTPTRELAAQVAGIATVLAPPGSVRLVFRPTNLLKTGEKERGQDEYGNFLMDNEDDDGRGRREQRLFIGSAKAIMTSLYGDGKMPAPPTPKPQAMFFLRNVQTLVMDEVDRLLQVGSAAAVAAGKKKPQQEGGRGASRRFKDSGYDDDGVQETSSPARRHERPAAILASAVARLTLGRAQIVAASATVGRPLKREVARVLGLPAKDGPVVLRGTQTNDNQDNDDSAYGEDAESQQLRLKQQSRRAVTIPRTVQHYVKPLIDNDKSKHEQQKEIVTSGMLLTNAFQVIQELHKQNKHRKMLLVLTRNTMATKHAVGALRHFQCQPTPISLLDALEGRNPDGDLAAAGINVANGSDHLMTRHREVSGATGIGESFSSSPYFTNKAIAEDDEESKDDQQQGYLFVTGEDTIRGLHLDGLDLVIVVGRPQGGPDEYTHIAGRTGRAGKAGKVLSIVKDASMLTSWESMLETEFHIVRTVRDAANVL